jgi:hypothetical protein
VDATAPVTVLVTAFFVVLVVPEPVDPSVEPVDGATDEVWEPPDAVPDTMATCDVALLVPEVDV